MPYRFKPLAPLQGKKCDSCRFCVWDDERKEYGCYHFGCVGFGAFVEYQNTYVPGVGWK